MPEQFARRKNEIDARDLRVEFSPAVQDAFRAIAVAASKSEHFDTGMYEIIKNWSNGKPTTVHDFMVAIVPVADEVTAHISRTDDQLMKGAWDDLSTQLSENGFAVSQSLKKHR